MWLIKIALHILCALFISSLSVHAASETKGAAPRQPFTINPYDWRLWRCTPEERAQITATLEHGDYINLQTRCGYTVLTKAREENNTHLIDHLRQAAHVTSEDLAYQPSASDQSERTLWAPKTAPSLHLKNPAGLCWLITTVNIIQQLRSVRTLLDDIQDKRVYITPAPDLTTPEGQEYRCARNLIDALYGVIVATSLPDGKDTLYYADDFFRAYYAYDVQAPQASRFVPTALSQWRAYKKWSTNGGEEINGWYTIMRALQTICPNVLSGELDPWDALSLNWMPYEQGTTSMSYPPRLYKPWIDGLQEEQTFDEWLKSTYAQRPLSYIIPVQCARLTHLLQAPADQEILPRSFVINGLRYNLRAITCDESFFFGRIGHIFTYIFDPNGNNWLDEGTGVLRSTPRVITRNNFSGYVNDPTKTFDDIEHDLLHGFCSQLKYHHGQKTHTTRKKIRVSMAFYEQDLDAPAPAPTEAS